MASDEGMGGVEDALEEIDEQEESNPLSAEEIVSASLGSGSLTDICKVSVTMRVHACIWNSHLFTVDCRYSN